MNSLWRHLNKLVGGTITNLAIDESEVAIEIYGEPLISFDVCMPNGAMYNVQPFSDPEGNSQGHLDIQELELTVVN